MQFSILDTGVQSASENMNIDRNTLNHLDPNGKPILHLYDWEKKSLTYGHFAKPETLLDFEGIEKYEIDCAKRVTGGGVTLHFTDFAFSFFMPGNHPCYKDNTLENYAFVNQVVVSALRPFIDEKNLKFFDEQHAKHDERFFFCMAKPTRYDVMVEGKKVGGAAQRKTKRGYLHHGTISLIPPDPCLLKAILKDKQGVYQAILNHSYSLSPCLLDEPSYNELKHEVRKALIGALTEA